ncbi:MAG: ribonuclease Z [Planctomycetes bacterium]|nr:ribonuclease Z [Planctomycetota bacterium]
MRLVPLGTGSILMRGGRSASGYLLEAHGQRTLIDCGPGTLLRLQQAGVGPETIDHVVLSHFHPDHHADLLPLLFLRNNPSLTAASDLILHGPPGLQRILDAWDSVYGKWTLHPRDRVHELDPGPHAVGEWMVVAHRAAHTMPSYIYRISRRDGSGPVLVYSGDSGPCAELTNACHGADFCVLECSVPDDAPQDARDGHMTPKDVARIVTDAKPRCVALTHFYPAMFPLLSDRAGLERAILAEAAGSASVRTRFLILEDLQAIEIDCGMRAVDSPPFP